jgi:hypothetical protein
MSQRIALRCPHCQMVSYRPIGFVRAKLHFVCNYCHEMSKIDRHELNLALAPHARQEDADDLEQASDTADGTDRHR